jgi:hypothetical protein
MNIKNLTAAVLALTTGILEANLFDDEDKLKERYGEPVETEVGKYNTKQTYKWREYVITVKIDSLYPYEGQTVHQSTRRLDGQPTMLAEIASLLKRNYHSGEWKGSGVDKWHMGSYAVAEYNRFSRTLTEQRRR